MSSLAQYFDVLIIGGGPSGVSCALECQDSHVSHLLIERNQRLGGQLPEITTEVPNFAAGRASGAQWQEKLEIACQEARINYRANEPVVSIDLEKKVVVTTTGVYIGRAIYIATGYRLKNLKLIGGEAVAGDVFYRTGETEQGLLGKEIAIVGGGDSALLEALARVDTAASVTVLHRSSQFKARPDVIEAVKNDSRIKLLTNCEIAELRTSPVKEDGAAAEQSLGAITIRSTVDGTVKQIEAEKLVVKVGYSPNTELFEGQLLMDQNGHIRIGQDCSTSIAGVFAGGDIASPGYDRIATAMGHGMIAAGSIRKFLLQDAGAEVAQIERLITRLAQAQTDNKKARV